MRRVLGPVLFGRVASKAPLVSFPVEEVSPPVEGVSPPVEGVSPPEGAPALLEADRGPGSDSPFLITGSSGPVGGRLALFALQWESVTNDPFILSVISHGFKISLSPGFPGVLRQITYAPGIPSRVRLF